jgi:hypothetical protein
MKECKKLKEITKYKIRQYWSRANLLYCKKIIPEKPN